MKEVFSAVIPLDPLHAYELVEVVKLSLVVEYCESC